MVIMIRMIIIILVTGIPLLLKYQYFCTHKHIRHAVEIEKHIRSSIRLWRVKEDEMIMQNQRSKSTLNQQCRLPVTTSAQTVKQMLNQSDQDPDLAESEYVWQ